MSKSQVNFRLPAPLIAALKARAEAEGISSTELATRLLEAGLGLSSLELANDDPRIEERITISLEQRIEKHIANQLAPLQSQLEQRIEERIQTAIQSKVDAVLGECSA